MMKSCPAKKRWSAADSVKLAVRSTFPVKNGSSFYYSIKISTQKGTDCVINMQKAEAGETDEGERRQARGMSQCSSTIFRVHAMWAWGLLFCRLVLSFLQVGQSESECDWYLFSCLFTYSLTCKVLRDTVNSIARPTKTTAVLSIPLIWMFGRQWNWNVNPPSEFFREIYSQFRSHLLFAHFEIPIETVTGAICTTQWNLSRTDGLSLLIQEYSVSINATFFAEEGCKSNTYASSTFSPVSNIRAVCQIQRSRDDRVDKMAEYSVLWPTKWLSHYHFFASCLSKFTYDIKKGATDRFFSANKDRFLFLLLCSEKHRSQPSIHYELFCRFSQPQRLSLMIK